LDTKSGKHLGGVVMAEEQIKIHGLRPQGSYLVTENCAMVMRGGNPLVQTGKELQYREGGALDNRMNIVSFNNTMDAREYIQYFKMISDSANVKLATVEFMTGRFVALLDSGFVPYYMPPTFFHDELRDFFMMPLLETGIQFEEHPVMNFEGQLVSVSNQVQFKDIWVSKLDACDMMGVKLKDFNTLNFIKEVISRCAK